METGVEERATPDTLQRAWCEPWCGAGQVKSTPGLSWEGRAGDVNTMDRVPACKELSLHFCAEDITSLSNRLETGRGILILQLRI